MMFFQRTTQWEYPTPRSGNSRKFSRSWGNGQIRSEGHSGAVRIRSGLLRWASDLLRVLALEPRPVGVACVVGLLRGAQMTFFQRKIEARTLVMLQGHPSLSRSWSLGFERSVVGLPRTIWIGAS